MNLGWLVRRWKLVVLMPLLAYVVSIPASLIAYAAHDLALATAILEDALWVSIALGVTFFVLFIALGIARPVRDVPRVGMRHVFLFIALFIALVVALYVLVLHAPPTLAEAYFIFTVLNFSYSLANSALVLIGLVLHNFVSRIKGSVALRGLLLATIIAPALAITIAVTVPTPATAPMPHSFSEFLAEFAREFTKSAPIVTAVGLATALPLEVAFIIMRRKKKSPRRPQ
jgi:hypothetical protein